MYYPASLFETPSPYTDGNICLVWYDQRGQLFAARLLWKWQTPEETRRVYEDCRPKKERDLGVPKDL